MKFIKYISIILLAFLIYSCEETSMPLFDAENSFVYFEVSSTSVSENSATVLEVPVSVAGVKGADVEVFYSIKGIGSNPAEEGKHFTVINSGNKVTVSGGTGTAMIQIQPIDDSNYTNDKTFEIILARNSANFYMADSGNNVVTVTILDDDIVHPLASLFGAYEQHDYNYPDAEHDEYSPYDITISYVEGNESQISINNFWGAEMTVIADVDINAKSINILPDQIIYIDETYGECRAVKLDLEAPGYAPADPIPCTIEDDGTIMVGAWSALVEAGSFGDYIKTELIKK